MGRCKGSVQSRGKTRRCANRDGRVLPNGYCNVHQNQALQEMRETVIGINQELSEVKRRPNTHHKMRDIQHIQEKLQAFNHEISKAQTICTVDPSCMALAQYAGAKMEVLRQSGIQVPSSSRMLELASGSGGSHTDAINNSQTWESNQQLLGNIDNESRQIENRILNEESKTFNNTHEDEAMAQSIVEKINQVQAAKMESEKLVIDMQKKLDLCQASSRQALGAMKQDSNALVDKVEKYKSLYENMIQREIQTSKSVKVLKSEQNNLNLSIEKLKNMYGKELNKMKAEFDTKVSYMKNQNPNLMVDGKTSNEIELEDKIEEYEENILKLEKALKKTTKMGNIAVQGMEQAGLPQKDMADELYRTSSELRDLHERQAHTQSELDKKRLTMARYEQELAGRVEKASKKDRQTIMKLSSDVTQLNQKLADRQTDIAKLQRSLSDNQSKGELQIRGIMSQLANMKRGRADCISQMARFKEQLDNQKLILNRESESKKANLEFQFRTMTERLKMDYDNRVGQIKAREEELNFKVEDERRDLAKQKGQISEMKKELSNWKSKLDRYRTNYDSQVLAMEKQRSQYNDAISKANSQRLQFRKMESDYKKRVEMVRNTLKVHDQRNVNIISKLKTRLNELDKKRIRVIAGLEKCAAARSAMATRVQNMEGENTRLKDMVASMETRIDKMKIMYEQQMDKIRTEARQINEDNQKCKSVLQETTLAHDHMKRQMDAARAIRRQFQQEQKKTKQTIAGLRQMLKDRALDKQSIEVLKTSLSRCQQLNSRQKSQAKTINEKIYGLKNMNENLQDKIQNIGETFERQILKKDAQYSREVLSVKSKQTQLEEQLKNKILDEHRLKKNLNKSQRRREDLEDMLADEEVTRARQIQTLLASQREVDNASRV
jgi:predicted  nucleic acid-binding Zn-ribbon protein